jgi:LysM repeat protein
MLRLGKRGIIMSQNNYRDKVEAHRQSIQVERANATTNPGRATRRTSRNEQQKKHHNKLVTVLGSVFVLVPVLILVYFGVIANSGDKTTQDLSKDVNVQTNNNNIDSSKVATDDDDESEAKKIEKAKAEEAAKAQKAAEEKEAAEKAAKEKAAKEKAEKQAAKEKAAKEAAEKAAAEKAAKEKAAKEAAAKAAAQKAAQEKAAKEAAARAAAEKAAKEKAAKEAAAQKAAQEKAAKEAAAKAAAGAVPNTSSAAYRQSIQKGYLHNAVSGDTVQSISLKYYGTTAKAGAIRQLNGLSSDKVKAGVKIALPMQ